MLTYADVQEIPDENDDDEEEEEEEEEQGEGEAEVDSGGGGGVSRWGGRRKMRAGQRGLTVRMGGGGAGGLVNGVWF
jgi:hypothetical protein